VAKIRAELGIESLGSDATFEEVSQNIMDVMSDARKMAGINFRTSIGGDGFEEWLSGFNAIAYEATETTAGSLGFDIRNVDQFAIFGDRMFGGEVLLGKFDPEVTKAAFYHFGRGGRILVMDGMAARTLSHDPMQQIIDASTDVQPSLADDPNYIMAANLLTKFGTAGALFSGDSENVEQAIARLEDMWGDGLATLATADEVRDQFAQAHLIEAYEVAALGTAFPAGEGESPNTYTVLIYTSEDAATKNAAQLKLRIDEDDNLIGFNHPQARQSEVPARWSEQFTSYEVWSEGNALILRVTSDRFGDNVVMQLLPSSGDPFIHRLLVTE
jgi:hypothetical protein